MERTMLSWITARHRIRSSRNALGVYNLWNSGEGVSQSDIGECAQRRERLNWQGSKDITRCMGDIRLDVTNQGRVWGERWKHLRRGAHASCENRHYLHPSEFGRLAYTLSAKETHGVVWWISLGRED